MKSLPRFLEKAGKMSVPKGKVLVVDDEEDVRAYLSTWFSDHGFSAETAASGDEALKIAEKDPPALITLDVLMPGKTGMKFYRELKKTKKLASIPVIVITGMPRGETEQFFKQAGLPPPAKLLAKPFNIQELEAAVKEALSAPKE